MQWVSAISNAIDAAFANVRPKLIPIPPLILVCGVRQRPGLSAVNTIANIIRRLPEAGAYTGTLPDGSPNVMDSVIRVIVEEIIKEIRLNARVDCAINPSVITSYGTGASPVGPVTVFSTNIGPVSLSGIVR